MARVHYDNGDNNRLHRTLLLPKNNLKRYLLLWPQKRGSSSYRLHLFSPQTYRAYIQHHFRLYLCQLAILRVQQSPEILQFYRPQIVWPLHPKKHCHKPVSCSYFIFS